MSKCLKPQTLEQFAAGTLEEAEMTAAAEHIEKCRRCGVDLDKIAMDADLLQDLKEAASLRHQLKPDIERLSKLEGSVTTTLFEHG